MDVLMGSLIALGIGSLVGLERERKKKFTGIRTLMLISLLGFLSFYTLPISPFVLPIAMLAITLMAFKRNGNLDTTTYVASLVVFILGGLVAINLAKYAASLSLIMMAILALRDKLHHFADSFTEKELSDIIKLGALILVIMPLLPNRNIDPWSLINPFKIWLMLIVILGLSFIGYMLVKFFGPRAGIILTALFGGFASSTALTFEMTSLDKKHKGNLTGIAAFLGSSTMFLKVPLLLVMFSPALAASVSPGLGSIFAMGVLISYILLKDENQQYPIQIKNPLDFLVAIKFVSFFIIASAMVHVGMAWYGNTGAYLAAFIGGFTDVDPVVLVTTKSLLANQVTLDIAKNMVMIGVLANTLTKAGLMIIKGKKTTKKLGLVLIGLALLLFIPI